jgi:ABC-type glycerol-3-phosphate transport system substrate-binding protein
MLLLKGDKIMKKKIALLLTIAMMTGLAACGSGQTTKEETAAASGTEAAVEQQSAEEKETAAETESITETQAAAAVSAE